MIDFDNLIARFNENPILIQIVWVLSVILLLIIGVLFVYLMFLRRKLRKRHRNELQLKKEYEALLIQFIYEEKVNGEYSKEQQSILKKLRKASKNDQKRKMIVAILINLRGDISGELSEEIRGLYLELGLLHYSTAKLKSPNWDLVVTGIRELTQFSMSEVHDEVVVHLNHKKKEVRKEVQLYLVYLFQFEGLNFLNDLQDDLSEWDQIKLLEVLQGFDNQQIPDITSWLLSENEFVVDFSLKLAKIYNQYEAKDTLLKLLDHESSQIRINCIEVFRHLHLVDAKEKLMENFHHKAETEQLTIIQYFENVFEETDKDFLKSLINHKLFDIRLVALRILAMIDPEYFEMLSKEGSNDDTEVILNYLNE